MRVCVLGARGLVGSELRTLLREGRHDSLEGDLPEADITGEAASEEPALDRWMSGQRRGWKPEWVVNLAAWTDVDGCEKEPDVARICNFKGAGNVAEFAVRSGARMLHVSTDYVFDGKKGAAYAEEDAPAPLSVYGRTKHEGEIAVGRILPAGRLLLVRGQSLYGAGRKSFPDAILRAAAAKSEIPVVTDQVVSPTWARDFAEGLVRLMEGNLSGTFHLSASGRCSWNEFARAVLEEAGVEGVRVTETTAAALGRPAPRPAYSVFDLGKFERATGVRPRPWREQLRDYLRSTGRAA